MPYKVEFVSAKEARRAKRFNNETTRILNKISKYKTAEKKKRENYKINIRYAERNRESAERLNLTYLTFIRMQYAWCRQKIQNPNTPAERKFAYRKVARMLEAHFTHRYLVVGNPAFRQAGPNMQGRLSKEAYELCWVNPRIP